MQLNFVLCPRFHGATAFGLLLNNHDQVSSLGDMFPSAEFDQSCGCGKKVSGCPFWQSVARRFSAMNGRGSRQLYPAWPLLTERRSINDAVVGVATLAALYASPLAWRMLGGAAGEFIDFYPDFVRTVNEFERTSVFVNGQKSLKSVLAVKSILGSRARVKLLHLVRDPRGFHCSEMNADAGTSLDQSARRWLGYHRRARKLVAPMADAGYLAVRYEDLCARPQSTMRRVFEFLGVAYQDVFRPPSANHLVGHGSKGRFDGTLRQSLSWQSRLTATQQARCLALTQPESQRHGYHA